MIITVSGKPGSGKSTVAKLVAKKLKLRHYSIGDFMREIALKRGMTLLELSKIAEKDKTIDKELDEKQKKLLKEDNFIIDSRLGFYFFPNSIKVFLDVTLEEGARRILEHKRKEERENISIKETEKNIKRRLISEKRRYKRDYNVDFLDKKNFDIIVDTTNLDAEKVADIIVNKIKQK